MISWSRRRFCAAHGHRRRQPGVPVSSDVYIAGGPGSPANFGCTRWLLGHMDSQGKLPPSTDSLRPANCPQVTVPTNCKKMWNGNGRFPDGNILDCDLKADGGNKDNMGNLVLTALNKLGNYGRMPIPSDTEIKKFLGSKNANVLIFTDAAKQASSFTQWYAQAFAINSKDVATTSSSNIPELDIIVRNGYFSCTAGTGEPLLGGGTVPEGWLRLVYKGDLTVAPGVPAGLPSACTSAMPSNYPTTSYRY